MISLDIIKNVVLSIGNNTSNISCIQEETKITYAYLIQIINLLAKQSIISKEKNGRSCNINLTEKGKELYGAFMDINSLFNMSLMSENNL